MEIDIREGFTAGLETHGRARTVGIADHPKVATTQARLSARDVKSTARGTEFMLVEGEQQHQVDAPVVGLFNVSNLLCAAATLRAQGIALADIATAMVRVAGVPGRLERVNLAPQVPANKEAFLLEVQRTNPSWVTRRKRWW